MFANTRNLKVFGGAVTAALLTGVAVGYLFSRWQLNDRKFSELKQAYGEIKSLNEKETDGGNASGAVASRESGDKGGAALKITFRAIGHDNVSPAANQETAFEVLNEIKSSDYFDASRTKPDGAISAEVAPGTFSFRIVTKLKRPLTL
jgi:hypothetical protein